MAITDTRLKDTTWNKLNSKLSKNKDKNKFSENAPPPKVHCRIPKCLGWEKEPLKKENDLEREARERQNVNDFKALIKGIIEKNYDYTIYLSFSPKNIKALSDWLLANAEILSIIPKNKIVLISEWRKTPTWELAYQRYKNLWEAIEKISNMDPYKPDDAAFIKNSKKLIFPYDESGKNDVVSIWEEARKIADILNKMLALDLKNTKKREGFKDMSEEMIMDHIKVETSDYISWKQLLNKDGSEPTDGEINALMYPHDLFKSMQIIDAFADKMGYTKTTPVHLVPETEEFKVENSQGKDEIQDSEYINNPLDVTSLLTDITVRLAQIEPQKGAKFFSDFINFHTQAKKEVSTLTHPNGVAPLDVINNSGLGNRNRLTSPAYETKNKHPSSATQARNKPQSTYNFVNGELKQKSSAVDFLTDEKKSFSLLPPSNDSHPQASVNENLFRQESNKEINQNLNFLQNDKKKSTPQALVNDKNRLFQETYAKTHPEKPKLTAYQEKLADRIRQLEGIIFDGGAERGYGRMLAGQFPHLQKLRNENPTEHDSLINSNPRYKELYEMFPNWTDKNHLQARYEAQDEGPFMAVASAFTEDGGEKKSPVSNSTENTNESSRIPVYG